MERIRAEIAQIASKRKNTTADEINWVMKQLQQNGYDVRSRNTSDGVLYGIGHLRFSVCTHNPGGKQVKPCYVNNFLTAMIELDLYDE